MINLRGYKGFAIYRKNKSPEIGKLALYCLFNDIPLLRLKKNDPCPENYIPVGSVEFCLKILNRNIIPDYYPDFLSNYLNRKVWKQDKWVPNQTAFIKPADKYKRFSGFVQTIDSKKKRPPFWCSEIINFENEWRYYISNGKIICGEWYSGDEINTPSALILNIEFPKNFCGAVDFGLFNGNITLVESHHPFACGWYGKKDEVFFQWLIDGWISLNV